MNGWRTACYFRNRSHYMRLSWSFLGHITRVAIQATLERWETISHWQRLKGIKTPTREGIGSIVQECGIRNREFLSLTTPRTIGDATRLRTRVSCGKKIWNMTKLRNYYLRSNSFCYRALVEWRSRRHESNSRECVWPCRLDNNALAYQKTGLPQMIAFLRL